MREDQKEDEECPECREALEAQANPVHQEVLENQENLGKMVVRDENILKTICVNYVRLFLEISYQN